ncbi:DUF721 domain-containing protein [uncultured Alsobacter sp.]|uniref:DUF721 domain-containing protein n=1 Tax=uncultured Alsobacter sp. TaxID=1748258 RepID=UPI0025E041CB|nr:DciA family protein [uncultured Alsobacter sp.]
MDKTTQDKAPSPRPFKPRLSPLADLLDSAIGPILAAKGFAASDVVVGWPEIVGPRLAPHCEPLRMRWPRKPAGVVDGSPGEPATLEIRVEGAFALEVQHMVPVIMERVNTRYGWRCVGRIVLKQGPVGRDRVVAKPPPPPDESAVAAARDVVGGVEDDALRDALVRLGAGILSRKAAR